MKQKSGELTLEEIDKCHATARHLSSKKPFTVEEMEAKVEELRLHMLGNPKMPISNNKRNSNYTPDSWARYVEDTWRVKAFEVWAMAKMQLNFMRGDKK
jgi:hypothetical protein